MASYAPLFAHAEGWQWTPDLIWFDNFRSYGTPNYYVQKLFANNKGTDACPILSGKEEINGQNGLFASAVWDKNSKELIVKIVNVSDKTQTSDLQLTWKKNIFKWNISCVKSENLMESIRWTIQHFQFGGTALVERKKYDDRYTCPI